MDLYLLKFTYAIFLFRRKSVKRNSRKTVSFPMKKKSLMRKLKSVRYNLLMIVLKDQKKNVGLSMIQNVQPQIKSLRWRIM